jgi:hypothetical protein
LIIFEAIINQNLYLFKSVTSLFLSTIKQKKKMKKHYNSVRVFFLVTILFLTISAVKAQSVGDYRSVVSGNWSTLASWQRLNALPSTWGTPTSAQGYPGQYATTNLTVQTTHDMVLDVSPAYAIINLTTEGTGRLKNAATNGLILYISGNIKLGTGSAEKSDPINLKLSENTNTVILNGTNQQIISGDNGKGTAYFYNLTVSNLITTGGVLLNNSAVVEGNLTVGSNCLYDISTYISNKTSSPNATFSFQSGSIFRLSGSTGGATGSNFPIKTGGAGTFTYSIDPTSTIEYYGNGGTNQTICTSYITGTTPATEYITYGNLKLSNGNATGIATKNLTSNITGIAGNLTIGDEVSYDISTYNSNCTANTVDFSLNGTGTLKLSGNNFPGGFNSRTLSLNSTVEYYGTLAQSILAFNYGNLTSSNTGTRTLPSTGTVGIYGAFTPGTNSYTVTGSTVNFNGITAQTIPGFTFNNLIINNNIGATLNGDVTVNNSLLINSGTQLIVPTLKQLYVLGIITNNNGTSGLVIQSNSTEANGSLIFHNTAVSPVQATVEMYSKAAKSTNYKWQFFGIPLRSMVASPTFDGSYVRQMFENNNPTHWYQLNGESPLISFTGYEITQVSPTTVYFQGELENSDFSSGKLSFTSDATYPGQHLIGNPYTAAIDIKKITFGSTNAAVIENTVYLYNTGSYADWTNAGSGTTSGTAAGQYIAVPVNTAGLDGLPTQVPSMQAFLVRAKSDNDSATISIPYSSTGTMIKNTEMQRCKVNNKAGIRIDVNGSRFSDHVWLFTESTCSHNFDNGWDGYKFGGSVLAPELYIAEADGDYQVSTVDDINNTVLGFKAGEDSVYTLTFTNENLESGYKNVYLVDLLNNTTKNIFKSGTTYSFTSSDSLVNRFKIVTSLENNKNDKKDKKPDINQKHLNIFSNRKSIIVENGSNEKGDLMLYDSTLGRLIKKLTFNANCITTLQVNVPDGLYLVKGVTKSEEFSKCVLLK